MKFLKYAAITLAVVVPGGVIAGALVSLAVVAYRRVRERNRVTMVQVATRRVTLQAFVPRQSAVIYRA